MNKLLDAIIAILIVLAFVGLLVFGSEWLLTHGYFPPETEVQK